MPTTQWSKPVVSGQIAYNDSTVTYNDPTVRYNGNNIPGSILWSLSATTYATLWTLE